ncbi:hypothetical protein N0V90_001323 [Kalmusia sp. IMI 367209]|nr:hypothetical protein N0V90_001323 [Kalmusia sp. IMI 367209]
MGNQGLGQVISWYICTIASVPFVALRMYSRWTRIGYLAIEDYLIILAVCCLIGDLGIQQHMWNLGLGDMSTVTPEKLKGIMQMIVPGSILYVSSLWAVKFALVFFYKRLAAPGSRLILVYNIALGGLAATFLVIFFDILFQCYPYDKRWSNNPNYQCDPKAATANYWITITFNIFSDAIIIGLPITMISRLQMKLKQKIAVGGIFALGFFVIISSTIIAACLPALRSMVIGGSTNDPSSYGKHYELGSARRRTNENRTGASGGIVTSTGTNSHVRKGRDPNGSEDSLVASGLSVGLDGRGKIRVDTTIEARYEDEDFKSKAESSRSDV